MGKAQKAKPLCFKHDSLFLVTKLDWQWYKHLIESALKVRYSHHISENQICLSCDENAL